MQEEPTKVSRITIRADRAVGGSMSQRGANLDTLGFNLRFILERNPKLAIDVFKLYRQASELKPDDPTAPVEDLRWAADEMERLAAEDL